MYCSMSYKNFIWRTNPYRITVISGNNVAANTVPESVDYSQEISVLPRKIIGEGTFFGDDAYKQITLLQNVLLKGGTGQLFIPNMTPIHAFFTRLEIKAQRKNSVDYAFTFVEDTAYISNENNDYVDFTYIGENENLFHISNRTGVAVDELMKLNNFPTPFDLVEGGRVRLR